MPTVTQGDIKRFLVGTITANGTSDVTLTVPNLEVNTCLIVCLNTAGGTAAPVFEKSRNVSTGVVTFVSSSGNTGVYNVFAFA